MIYKLSLEQLCVLIFGYDVNYYNETAVQRYLKVDFDKFKTLLPDFIPEDIINQWWKKNITDKL